MARYLTQDLNVDLGDEMPEDTTLNMLQFRERQTTLVIARSTLPEHQTLDEAYAFQLDLLHKRLAALTCTDPVTVFIGKDKPVEGREAVLQFTHANKPMYQLQLACQLPGQQRLLVLNYSKHSALSEADIGHWRAIKDSLHFA
ncbi:DcrB-related protein [Pseudomonas paralactis]|uniref:DcrB-related protein n=1 Tax=Pseudomonas paralactis TaxID=1615673 RepID=A0ABS0V7X4_9PSED|nr:DcrB-related protein [Pseudomonas paralactis]MBI6635227.1 DcrB-related protein [Pseudomonas paralactis]